MKYKTVVIDPPWDIPLAFSAKSFQGGKLRENIYDTLEDDELRQFPIDEYAAEECLLFIWTTNGRTKKGTRICELALELIDIWGFDYRLWLYWLKPSGFAVFLPFRSTVEPILFASRGIKNIKPYGRYSNVFNAPNKGHSVKPSRFYQMLREWTPEPRIDIFARNAHYGFDGWGDEYVGEGPLMEFLQ